MNMFVSRIIRKTPKLVTMTALEKELGKLGS